MDHDQVAFLLFPVEVWEVILRNMEESKDIFSVFRAYPELEREGVLKKRRPLWLFDQVAPHIFPWLQRKEMLSCRQVCYQWWRGADHAGTVILRSLRLSYCGFYTVIPSVELAWARDMEMMERFGKNILFLDLFIDYMTFRRFYENVLRILELAPNLRRLSLRTGSHFLRSKSDSKIEGLHFLNTSGRTFMPLVHLESLDIASEDIPAPIITFLIQFHERRIKRLEVQRWNFTYRNIFINLAELYLRDTILDSRLDSCGNKGTLINILRSLNAPKLQKIVIPDFCPILSYYECKIVPLLSRFSCLESISVGHTNVDGDDYYEEWGLIADCCELRYSEYFTPSIKYIAIGLERDTETLNFNIFHCFPSLAELTIYWSGNVIPGCFQSDKMYKMKIWDVLPDLDKLTINCSVYEEDEERFMECIYVKIPMYFSRFQYDLLRSQVQG